MMATIGEGYRASKRSSRWPSPYARTAIGLQRPWTKSTVTDRTPKGCPLCPVVVEKGQVEGNRT